MRSNVGTKNILKCVKYREKKKVEMEQQFKNFQLVVKSMGTVDTQPDVAAREIYDDYNHLIGEFLDKKMASLDMVQKEVEVDESHHHYLTLSRQQRLAEIKILKEQIEKLEALEYNWSVVGFNRYMSDVVDAMKLIHHKREGEIIEHKAAKKQRSCESSPSGV